MPSRLRAHAAERSEILKRGLSVPSTCAEENSEAFAGQHDKNCTSFFLFDESSLIPDKIWEVAGVGLTDGEPMWFAFGNPTRNTDAFYEATLGNQAHRWHARSIDSHTCKFPNHRLYDEWIHALIPIMFGPAFWDCRRKPLNSN